MCRVCTDFKWRTGRDSNPPVIQNCTRLGIRLSIMKIALVRDSIHLDLSNAMAMSSFRATLRIFLSRVASEQA